VTLILALVCGGVAALPFAGLARRVTVAERLRPLRGNLSGAVAAGRVPRFRLGGLGRPKVVSSIMLVLGAPRARRRRRRRDAVIARELPVVVDLVGVAVAAGCTPYLAIEHAARYGPERVALVLRDVLQACALGQALDEALRDLGAAIPMLRPLAEALRTSARLGSPAAPALARLAAEVRADFRRSAEARARTVPVRLVFPLVACVLPAFALLTVVPAVLGGFHG
jgi:Flp pilus assembly protein TadB